MTTRIHSGALVALAVAIVLILRKGAAGGLRHDRRRWRAGCAAAPTWCDRNADDPGGGQGITNAVMRILAAGCWPGC